MTERTLTPVALAGLGEVLHAAAHSALGTCPGLERVAVAWAQLALEHGRDSGRLLGVWNYNLGNVDATMAERASLPTFATVAECEGYACGSRAVHIRRAFSTVEDGAAAYWTAMRTRFPDAYDAMSDPLAFVDALHVAGYFTGDPVAYGRAVVSLVAEYGAQVPAAPPTLPTGETP